jgi:enamine deaminase RidA (YjgF/YER057c/UK114 family)
MTVELMNPTSLSSPQSYSHVATARGTRIVYVSGQVADDPDGQVVGGSDLGAQARQAFANVGRALEAVGIRPDQVARITIYVVGDRPGDLEQIAAARIAVFGGHRPADVLLRVAGLAQPHLLIEVDAIAVLD